MDGFSVNTRLTAADWKALSVASSRRTQGRGWRGAAVVVGLPALIWALWVGLMHFVHSPVEANSLGIGVVVGYGAVYLLFRVVRSWHKPAAEGNFLGEWHYDFSPLGIAMGLRSEPCCWSMISVTSSHTRWHPSPDSSLRWLTSANAWTGSVTR